MGLGQNHPEVQVLALALNSAMSHVCHTHTRTQLHRKFVQIT